jgi:Ca2+:H+ antiporter
MRINYLLVFIPIAVVLRLAGASPLWIFLASALAIVPLAGLMGEATENLAYYLGPTIGGLLNASLGNAPEVIIAILALRNGLVDVVKASITGSILGNLLLTLGLSMFVGGLKRAKQTFNTTEANTSASMLLVAVTALIVPAVFHHATRDMTVAETRDLSLWVATVLFVVYLTSLVFTLVTHKRLFQNEASEDRAAAEASGIVQVWSMRTAIGVLTAVTIVLAIVSEMLTDALEPASEMLHLNPIFSGLILLAVVGNLAETINAVRFARSDKMGLAFGIATSASTQVSLLVAPLLVFVSHFMGDPLDLRFTVFEVVSVTLAVLIVGRVAADGACNWFEGVMLLGVYAILAIGFFFLPI